MSYEYSTRMNKQQKHPKVHNKQYLSNLGEPRDNISHDLDSPSELDAHLMENSYMMKRYFRHMAQNMRYR